MRKVTEIMRIRTKGMKKISLALIALPLLVMAMLASAPDTIAAAQETDPAAVYKAKCAMCHGAKAEKGFDATKPDDLLADAVLKGIKPKMPAYKEKGINANQAKALVAYMKQLKR